MMKDGSKMEVIETKSSFIDEIGYDPVSSSLFVKFRKGKVFRYVDVPKEIFAELKEVVRLEGSVGKFYSQKVKSKFQSVSM